MLGRAAGRCRGQQRADCGRSAVLAGSLLLDYNPSKKSLLKSAINKPVTHMRACESARIKALRLISSSKGKKSGLLKVSDIKTTLFYTTNFASL